MPNDKSSNTVIGYIAGIVAGISYGLNPLFAHPLMSNGVEVPSMLFFRYLIAVICMGVLMMLRKESFRLKRQEISTVLILGVLFAFSSLFLFFSYKYIPSGLATTLVYLYPVFTALIMVCLREYPTWKVWISIIATFAGVVLLCMPSGDIDLNMFGLMLAASSALSYSLYLVVVNKSKSIKDLSEDTLTFYALWSGAILFLIFNFATGNANLLKGIDTPALWGDLLALGIFPTMVSLLTLAISTRNIGATKTSVLGVFEPLTAIFIGSVVYNELMTTNMFIGAAICVAAVLFMVVSGKKSS